MNGAATGASRRSYKSRTRPCATSVPTPTRVNGRDDDGDGQREVHCNSCEGGGAALRTYLRSFRGVHKRDLKDYAATYEAMYNAKCSTANLIRQMCQMCRTATMQLGYTWANYFSSIVSSAGNIFLCELVFRS